MRQRAGTLLLVALLVVGCAGSPAASTPPVDPASQYGGLEPFVAGQIERIEASDDCEELQIIFDASAGAHDRFSDEEPPSLERMLAHTAIMDAADERLRAVGCYE